MPIYEYKCPSCRKVFEEWVREHDTAPQPCPDCGTISPHIVSNTTFVLKGGGWYATEYGNRKHESESSAPSDAAGTSVDAATDVAADSAAPPAAAGSKNVETGSKSAPPVVPAAPAARGAAAPAA